PPWKQIINRQDWVNRTYMEAEETQPQAKTFTAGLEFLQTNHQEDNWFLQIETFDPHEPFFSNQNYKDLYPHEYDGPHIDWPPYRRVKETPEQVEHVRYEYAALLSMCDHYLGKILDKMDALNLWDDTMLIVNTDHGFLLGEHDWWAKTVQPFYEEVSHTPLFIWDPRSKRQGERCDALVQNIDMAPTLLRYFGLEPTSDMVGVDLADTLASNAPTRDAILFGIHGGHVCCTDGRYVYMRAPQGSTNGPIYEYTLMPTHIGWPFSVEELQHIQLAEPFSFTKNCQTMKIEGRGKDVEHQFQTLLFDLGADPSQAVTLTNSSVEAQMTDHIIRLMKENDAPLEQYQRLGLPR
ncbi:MAG: sulfatase, partial [Chloroflexota bacterium]